MSFVDFTDWIPAMGNDMHDFQIHERDSDKTLVHGVYENNIATAIPITDIQFKGWFPGTPTPKKDGIVGSDDLDTKILRVNTPDYPVALTLEIEDTIKDLGNDKIYKIIWASDIPDKINVIQFRVKEFK
jgi:hypothetical protein